MRRSVLRGSKTWRSGRSLLSHLCLGVQFIDQDVYAYMDWICADYDYSTG